MKVLRTPEDRFAGLPDFGYPPRYGDVDGLRGSAVRTSRPRSVITASRGTWSGSAGERLGAVIAEFVRAHPAG